MTQLLFILNGMHFLKIWFSYFWYTATYVNNIWFVEAIKLHLKYQLSPLYMHVVAYYVHFTVVMTVTYKEKIFQYIPIIRTS